MGVKERQTILYRLRSNEVIEINVTQEVAEVLKQSQKKIHALHMQDQRHLSKFEYNDELSGKKNLSYFNEMDTTLLHKEKILMVKNSLKNLSNVELRRLILYYCEGLSCQKIAELESVRHQNVSKSLRAAIKKIRQSCCSDDD